MLCFCAVLFSRIQDTLIGNRVLSRQKGGGGGGVFIEEVARLSPETETRREKVRFPI